MANDGNCSKTLAKLREIFWRKTASDSKLIISISPYYPYLGFFSVEKHFQCKPCSLGYQSIMLFRVIKRGYPSIHHVVVKGSFVPILLSYYILLLFSIINSVFFFICSVSFLSHFISLLNICAETVKNLVLVPRLKSMTDCLITESEHLDVWWQWPLCVRSAARG